MSSHPTPGSSISPMTAARILGVTRRTIYRWIVSGKLPANKLSPKIIRIPRDVVNELLKPD